MTPQRRIALFTAVGTAAALVHWATAVSLVRIGAWAPLVANVAGWGVAFGVSYAGQSRLTFRDHAAPRGRSARRFFVVSLGGFLLNEAAYALLLHTSRWRYDLLLALVLAGVALLTYLLGRHWAFRS